MQPTNLVTPTLRHTVVYERLQRPTFSIKTAQTNQEGQKVMRPLVAGRPDASRVGRVLLRVESDPLADAFRVALHVLGGVAGQGVHGVRGPRAPRLLQQHAEDLALQILLQLPPAVAPWDEREGFNAQQNKLATQHTSERTSKRRRVEQGGGIPVGTVEVAARTRRASWDATPARGRKRQT